MKRTISIAKGRGSIGHNNRDFKAENVDPDRIKFNTCFVNDDIKEVYKNLFGEALENYNAKQKRNDRKIPDYYEKIRTSKQEKLFYEIIVQVGDFEDMNAQSDNGKIAEEILKEYMREFQQRNPTLHVFSAHLHMDEATPHLHIDFIPYTKGNKRGLETKTTLKGALNQLGFNGGTKSSTELIQWQDSEKEIVSKIMLEHGIEWEKKGGGKKHLPIETYKAEQKALEVEELDKEIYEKMVVVENLVAKSDMLHEEVYDRQQEVNFLKNTEFETKDLIKKLNEEADEVEDELYKKTEKSKKIDDSIQSLTKDKKRINATIADLEDNPKWQLPEAQILTTASTYKDKKAMPVVRRLKEFVKSLLIEHINLKNTYNSLLERFNNVKSELSTANNIIRKYASIISEKDVEVERMDILNKALGRGNVNKIIRDYRQEQLHKAKEEQLQKPKEVPKTTRKKNQDYER